VFVPTKWLPATPNNFPGQPPTPPKRIGFIGLEAPPEIQAQYRGRLVPAKKRGISVNSTIMEARDLSK